MRRRLRIWVITRKGNDQSTARGQLVDNEQWADRTTRSAFDSEERTAVFGESVIEFCQPLLRNAIAKPLISQLIRSSLSIRANYCEADEATTKKEFRYRISLCRRESRETKHWLRMLVAAIPDAKDGARILWKN